MHYAAELIEEVRRNKKISQKKLAKGICSPQALSKIERGEAEVDKQTFDIILERLGKSPDALECILSQQQYEKMVIRDSVEEAIMRGEIDKVRICLEKYKKCCKMDNKIDKMFCLRLEGFFMLDCTTEYEKAKECFQKAIAITLPDFKQNFFEDSLCSTWEIENVLGYAKSVYQLGNKDEAREIVDACYNTASNIRDKELRTRILPKCSYLKILWCEKPGYQEIAAGEEALELLRLGEVCYMVIPLVEELARIYCDCGMAERGEEWERLVKPLKEIVEQYAAMYKQDAVFFRYRQCTYHLDYEIIHGERTRRGYTQEELAEDIYQNQATISNIELGKTTPNPTGFKKLMEKLGMEKERQGGFIAVNSFEELDKIWQVRKAVGRGEVEEAEKIMSAGHLSGSFQLEVYRCISGISQKKASAVGKEIKALLNKTYPLDLSQYYRTPFQWEMDAILALGRLQEECNQREIESIWEKLEKSFAKSRRDVLYCYRIYAAVLGNKITYLAYNRKSEGLEKIIERAIRYTLACGKGGMFSAIMCAKTRQKGVTEGEILQYAYSGVLFDKFYKSAYVEEREQYYECLKKRINPNSQE